MSELLKLAERVEALAGADRQIDSEIVLALWPVVRIPAAEMFDPRRDGWHDPNGVLPGPWNYTASIDAAMTLVPEGFWTEIGINGSYATARINGRCDDETCAEFASCATPAIAIATVALRARTSS